MARGLSLLFGPAPRRGRRVAWFALVIGVIGVHGCVTDSVVERLAAVDADAAMPARMEVAYVREMTLSAPPPTAAPAAPQAAAVAPTVRVRKPKAPKPASAPEPVPDVVPPLAAAASEPAPEPVVSAASAAASAAAETAAAAAASAAIASASAASAAGADGPAFEWPASTRMTYLLTGNYRGAVSGSAQVEWVRVGTHYQVHVDFVVGPSFAPLITQRSTSDGEITAEGLAPRRYDQDIQFLTKARPRQTVLFDAGQVILANGDVRPAMPGLQDTASQFVQLTYLFSTRPELLKVGGRVEIPLALPKKVDLWVYDVVAEETLATPFGPVQGLHLKPRNERRPGTLAVEMWFAPQLRYFPARLRFEQDADTYVDLMISKPPDMEK